jgi:Zn-dependent M28 family amino/carboxypeptidase
MSESLAARLEATVRHLSGEIGERHFRRAPALDVALSFIRDELGRAHVTATNHEFEASGRQFTNVEVMVPARAGATQAGCIVVGAHYDTVPGTPGADDNATGVAALLELARELAHQNFERSLRLVFFPNEEPPFYPDAGMGSAAYAAQLRRAGVDVHTMISLEMLGYYSERPHSQRYPPGLSLFYPNRGNFIGFVSNLRSRKRLSELKRAFVASCDFPCESLAAPEWTVVVGLSDHSSFWKEGYPGLMVTDTAFMRNPHYHQASDTADTLDFERFAQVTAGLVGAVKRLASTIEP